MQNLVIILSNGAFHSKRHKDFYVMSKDIYIFFGLNSFVKNKSLRGEGVRYCLFRHLQNIAIII